MIPTAYRRNARGLRDRQAFEGVRMQAGALFAAGHAQAEVARTLGVARQNVSRWHARWRQGGLEGLRSAGPTGYDRALTTPSLPPSTRRCARAPGRTASTATTRPLHITTVIQRLTGVGYHRGHVRKLLRHRLHSRLQRPARRAVERDQRAIAAGWPRTGPRIRASARRRRAAIVFWDEGGASLLPVTRRTWAPRGRTPVIRYRCNRKRASMAAGLCYGSHGGGASLGFHQQVGAIVNSVGGSQAALSCTADVATGVHGLPGASAKLVIPPSLCPCL
jgi:transposase